jgi:hypothetical protein
VVTAAVVERCMVNRLVYGGGWLVALHCSIQQVVKPVSVAASITHWPWPKGGWLTGGWCHRIAQTTQQQLV